MEYAQFGNTFIVRVDRGEEIVASLREFCEKAGVTLGSIVGIGATDKATIGLFDVEKKEYFSKELTGNHEIAALVGNITTKDGEVYLHLHVTLGDRDHKASAGHLNSAVVSATFEAVVHAADGTVGRREDGNLGLNLLDFS